MGRRAIGIDVSSLSCFITRAKTQLVTANDATALREWAGAVVSQLNLRRVKPARAQQWIDAGYLRNLTGHRTWAVRKAIAFVLDCVELLAQAKQQTMARAVLLRTAQWALDCRTDFPTASRFRSQFLTHMEEMLEGAKAFRASVMASDRLCNAQRRRRLLVLNRSAEGLELAPQLQNYGAPRLVVTSPPYPGVHVMYHRWQVLGRKETPAPFWIANVSDGNGLSHYTFGDRQYPQLKTYFDTARRTFRSLACIADASTLFVQMLAFSDASWQLPQYLEAMSDAGLTELKLSAHVNAADGRLWRRVPGRKWYADQRGDGGASREVVLFHRRRASANSPW